MEENNQINLHFLNHFETFMSCSAKFLQEVLKPVSIKHSLKIILEVKNVKALHIWCCSSKSKKQECDH